MVEEVTLVRMIARQFEDMDAVTAHMPKEMITELAKGVSAQQLSDQIAQMFPFSLEKRQEFLETLGINDRLTLVLQEIQNEKQLSEIENKINEKVKERLEESQKEYYLREKMRDQESWATSRYGEGRGPSAASWRKIRIRKTSRTRSTRSSRYEMFRQPAGRPVSSRRYRLAVALPWWQKAKTTRISGGQRILDEDHYGLKRSGTHPGVSGPSNR
ncbi:MAG: LON peptidase substrate-binding domain-containing protein [Merdibacter sp.]